MNLREAARCLLDDYDSHRPGTMFERAELNFSVNDAYDLQFEVAALRESRGERVAGYKIGCISDTMQKQLGIDHPVFGHVWDTEIYRSGVQLDAENFDGLAIEGELAVRLLDDIPSAEWLRKNPQVVAGHVAVIELHNYVFRGTESIRAAELITNNAIHAGVVIANKETGSTRFNPNAKIRVNRNTERLGEGVVTHLQHGAIEVVASVAEHLARRGLNLKRDQIVLTGSPLPLWKVAPGERITVQCDGLSDVSCTIASGK
ncbi:MAG: fumarylacetoacetate hydrolase family protein [Planctomycetota bacterium]